MKPLVLFTLIVSTILNVNAQQVELRQFDRERVKVTRKGMLALGTWSAVNMVGGAIGTNANNPQQRYFHQMNVIWGGTNLLIAGLGYLGSYRENSDNLTLTSVLTRQNKMEKTFLFNAGLDVGYIAAGLYLGERSRRNADPSKLKGYGNSVMMQGGFLLLFDAVMYAVHNRHGKQLNKFTDNVSISAAPSGIGILYRLR